MSKFYEFYRTWISKHTMQMCIRAVKMQACTWVLFKRIQICYEQN